MYCLHYRGLSCVAFSSLLLCAPRTVQDRVVLANSLRRRSFSSFEGGLWPLFAVTSPPFVYSTTNLKHFLRFLDKLLPGYPPPTPDNFTFLIILERSLRLGLTAFVLRSSFCVHVDSVGSFSFCSFSPRRQPSLLGVYLTFSQFINVDSCAVPSLLYLPYHADFGFTSTLRGF